MRTAREQEARSIRAQGAKQAQIIRAEADAEAAQTYAASFGKDPDFYDFYRAMQSYQQTFVGDGQDKVAQTNIILSPQNDYLKQFAGRGAAK
jgi:membrane protease subunit HflC